MTRFLTVFIFVDDIFGHIFGAEKLTAEPPPRLCEYCTSTVPVVQYVQYQVSLPVPIPPVPYLVLYKYRQYQVLPVPVDTCYPGTR